MLLQRLRPPPAPMAAAAARFRRAVSSSSSSPAPHGAPTTIDVLYEDKHLIVVNKPAGLLSQAAAPPTSSSSSTRAAATGLTTDTDMLTLVRTHLTAAGGKPPSKPVYLGLVHRLDRNVSGAMVFAKRSKAAARLSEAFRTRAVRKVYVAVVLGAVRGRVGEARTLRHLLAFSKGKGKDKGNVTRVVGDAPAAADGGGGGSTGGVGGVVGTLRYTPLLVFPHPHRLREHETVLRVELVSGRKHQIRAQLSHIGHPIVGDVKYGAPAGLKDWSTALHCRTLAFAHPKREQREGGEKEEGPQQRVVVVDAPLPASWAARFGDAVAAAVERVKG